MNVRGGLEQSVQSPRPILHSLQWDIALSHELKSEGGYKEKCFAYGDLHKMGSRSINYEGGHAFWTTVAFADAFDL